MADRAAAVREVTSAPDPSPAIPALLRGVLPQTKGWGFVMTRQAERAEPYMRSALELLDPYFRNRRVYLYLMNISALIRVNLGDSAGPLETEKQIDWQAAGLPRRGGAIDAAAGARGWGVLLSNTRARPAFAGAEIDQLSSLVHELLASLRPALPEHVATVAVDGSFGWRLRTGATELIGSALIFGGSRVLFAVVKASHTVLQEINVREQLARQEPMGIRESAMEGLTEGQAARTHFWKSAARFSGICTG
ncbi:MAG: hypothetical protein HYX75_20705 [Acidobacteria bacterium]|nr:hypothetical protein [Acidobacteriota bacterium]